MIFHTIQPTPGLSPAHRRRANRVGPPATALRSSYQGMLRTAGFVDIEARDDTEQYRATMLRWIAANERHAEAIRTVIGDDAYDDRLRSRHEMLSTIEDGLLSRFRYYSAR